MRNIIEYWESVLTPAACDAWIHLAESHGFEDAPISTPYGFMHRPEVRNNTRVMLDDVGRAGDLWTLLAPRLHDLAPAEAPYVPVGLNERFRIYRYAPGQHFRWHHDGAFVRPDGELSRWTLIVYLNDDFAGGETEFRDRAVRPTRGGALLFSHGLLHQGAEVTRGVKYALRTDVMFRRVR